MHLPLPAAAAPPASVAVAALHALAARFVVSAAAAAAPAEHVEVLEAAAVHCCWSCHAHAPACHQAVLGSR